MKYSRVHRLLKIITSIQSAPSWDARRLAKECGTTLRTIYRDLNELEGAGIPYHFDEEAGGYRIRGDFFMPPVELTLEEAMALVCLAEHVGGGEQIPFLQPAARALTKVRSQLPVVIRDNLGKIEQHMELRLAASMPSDGVLDVYQVVCKAIATRRALRCSYESLRQASRPPPLRLTSAFRRARSSLPRFGHGEHPEGACLHSTYALCLWASFIPLHTRDRA